MKKYKAIYRDKHGTEISEFQSNGSELKIELRGIEFSGNCFEELEGKIDENKFDYVEYEGVKDRGDLTDCKFNLEIPLSVVRGEKEINKILQTEVQLGESENYGITIKIESEKEFISTSRSFGYFEDAIIDIQNQLPNEERLKCCLSCKFSHYNPYGNGMFGYLFCFKKIKEKTNQVEDKDSLFDLWKTADKENKIFCVQEVHVCEEHEFITNKDWNYSNWK